MKRKIEVGMEFTEGLAVSGKEHQHHHDYKRIQQRLRVKHATITHLSAVKYTTPLHTHLQTPVSVRSLQPIDSRRNM
jgi:hypothetical protein